MKKIAPTLVEFVDGNDDANPLDVAKELRALLAAEERGPRFRVPHYHSDDDLNLDRPCYGPCRSISPPPDSAPRCIRCGVRGVHACPYANEMTVTSAPPPPQPDAVSPAPEERCPECGGMGWGYAHYDPTLPPESRLCEACGGSGAAGGREG